MAFQKVYDPLPTITEPPCAYLRSKIMQIANSRHEHDLGEETGSRYCWCNKTQRTRGPDDQIVGRRVCLPERECYRHNG